MNERSVIIGGSSGIGLATARLFADAGHDVTITGRNAGRLTAALDSLPKDVSGGVTGRAVDALDSAAMTQLFAGLQHVDNVVIAATAGAGAIGPVGELPVDLVRETMDGKLLAYVTTVQAALPVLSTSGSITGISAASALASAPGSSALAAANAAIDTWIRVLAVELAPIRVNAVSPGIIDTPWWSFLDEQTRKASFEAYAKLTPAGRVGTADDVARTIRFLMESTFTTGVVVPCDGGSRLAGPQ